MKLKHIIFTFFLTLLFSLSYSKIEAVNISYCDYGNGVNLVLPVTVGVNYKVHHIMNQIKDYELNAHLFVYDEETCSATFSPPVIDSYYAYVVDTSFYYGYNSDYTFVDFPLGGGSYTDVDLIPPVITSSLETMTFSVDKYIELDYISVFIEAFDETDGNIIPEAIYDNYTPNYNKIGEYSIIFQACDSSNNCDNYTQKIKVHDITKPTIEGESKIISYMSNPITLIDIGKNLIATDNYDGDISTNIMLESSSYNPKIPGIYYAYYTVKDSSNNNINSLFKVEITVVDDIAPIIEGPTIYTSKLSNILSTKTILSNTIISDNSDNNAYKNIYIIDDNYTNNSTKVGEYTLVIGCYDKYGNESIPYLITIKTIDEIIPIIEGKSTYISYLSSPISLLSIKSNLVVLDNYDGNLFNKLEIIEDGYSNNKNSVGVFNVVFIVKDSSGNSSLPFNIEIVSQDDVSPVIQGTSFYTTLNTEFLDPISIKYNLSATDNVDGDISDKIELNDNTYINNQTVAGTYFLTFYVVDSNGNISNDFKVKITVNENLTHLQQINNSLIHLPVNNYKNDSDILSILGVSYSDYNSITTIENTYADNYNNVGKFNVKYELTNTDHTKTTININVQTYESEDSNKNNYKENKEAVISSNKKEENIFSKIFSFFKNLFNSFVNFFKKLFG